MFARERQNIICDLIKENGSVTTTELIAMFGVSIETIRRDLQELEKNNRLRRVHGGAIAVGEMNQFQELSVRLHKHDSQKKELSRTAAEMVYDGDVIGVDAGSTAYYFAQALKEIRRKVTVVTYSLDVFQILNGVADFEVILCGGHFLKKENAFSGPLTLEMLRQLHVQKAFVFPTAVSMQHGICDHEQEFVLMQKQLIACADTVYILADSSKFEKIELLRIAEMKKNYIYVTDKELSPGLAAAYHKNQYQLYVN